MPEVRPFAGYRYDPKKVGDLSEVVAPPYDVIDESTRDLLYGMHPDNIVRAILNRPFASDAPDRNVYTRARDILAAWLSSGLLVREARPALYLYNQRFTHGGRTWERHGLIAAVKLEPFGEGRILPHEHTLPGHKEDRLRLLRATRFNTSSVFAFHTDPGGTIRKAVNAAARGAPHAYAHDLDDNLHRLWVLTDEQAVASLTAALADQTFYIADGHHRYETALLYRDLAGPHHGDVSRAEAYVMMTLVPAEDPGLLALPTHRVVYGLDGSALAGLLEKAGTHFRVESTTKERVAALAEEAGEGPARVGVALPGERFAVLTLNAPEAMARRAPEKPDSWRNLDVTALHLLLMEDVLGIGAEALARHENVRYVRDAAEAISQVERGEDGAQAAFVMRPTPVRAIMRVSEDGERLPQKTSYFFPKLLTGLVLRRLD